MAPLLGEREEVPANKQNMISTRDNSEYKWQQARGVIGALEVPSVPVLEFDAEYTPRYVPRKEVLFDAALEVWHEEKLKAEFIKACKNVPPASFCCGLLPDQDQWMKNIIKSLNKGFIKATNQRFRAERKDVYLDIFNWNWHNATGKSTTNILLIRFFESKRQSIMDTKSDISDLMRASALSRDGTPGITDPDEEKTEEKEG